MEAMAVEAKAMAETTTSKATVKPAAKITVKPPMPAKTTMEPPTAAVKPTVAPKSAVTSTSMTPMTRSLARWNCKEERYSQREDVRRFPHLVSSSSWTPGRGGAFGSP